QLDDYLGRARRADRQRDGHPRGDAEPACYEYDGERDADAAADMLRTSEPVRSRREQHALSTIFGRPGDIPSLAVERGATSGRTRGSPARSPRCGRRDP